MRKIPIADILPINASSCSLLSRRCSSYDGYIGVNQLDSPTTWASISVDQLDLLLPGQGRSER